MQSDTPDIRMSLRGDLIGSGRTLRPSRLGLPSPADGITSPPGQRCEVAGDPAPTSLCDPLLDRTLPQPLPSPLAPGGPVPETPTPSQEHNDGLGLVGMLDGTLTDTALPSPSVVKAGHNLKLPSFDLLGIAAPHPDRIGSTSYPEQLFSSIGAGPLSKPEDPLHVLSPPLARPFAGAEAARTEHAPSASRPRAANSHKGVEQYITTFTPPDESGTISWASLANVRTIPMESPMSDPDNAPSAMGASSPAATSPAPSAGALGITTALDSKPWLRGALEVILTEMEADAETSGSVKVLSHALPCPSESGHVFPVVVNAIHEHIPPKSTVWINVFHAVPGRFNVADLPKSPPSTPGPAIGGEDYFTTKVFPSAVPVTDYQGEGRASASTSPPPALPPQPVVPPATIDFSIVERFIPPTNTIEFRDMFSTTRRSLLCDRLVELSLNNGILVFIYPTRTGGRTFMSEYLGPILEPLLRSMAIVNSLSADLGLTLGSMAAIEHLPEFADFTARLERLCRQLGRAGGAVQKFHGRRARFSLVHASKEEVVLDRKAWAQDWWIRQEKPRVREAVGRYFRMAQKLPVDPNFMPMNLIQEVLDGVATIPYPGSHPARGVEVGVFAIKKEAA